MTLDTTILAVLITLIMAVLAGGVWAGKMSEKIKGNRYDIEDQKEDMKSYRLENGEEHKAIILRLDKIINGKK